MICLFEEKLTNLSPMMTVADGIFPSTPWLLEKHGRMLNGLGLQVGTSWGVKYSTLSRGVTSFCIMFGICFTRNMSLLRAKWLNFPFERCLCSGLCQDKTFANIHMLCNYICIVYVHISVLSKGPFGRKFQLLFVKFLQAQFAHLAQDQRDLVSINAAMAACARATCWDKALYLGCTSTSLVFCFLGLETWVDF